MKGILGIALSTWLILWAGTWIGAAPSAQTVQVIASEWKFDPAQFTVDAGIPVQLTQLNKGTTQHDLAIEALGVSLPLLDPGKSHIVRFTPTRRGTFEFKCTVPGHAEVGMRGTITVR